jgi:hypothetical protein
VRSLSRLLLLIVLGAAARAPASCEAAALAAQHQDAATIARLEQAWTQAFLSGDTDFERCLLTADFTEILRDGQVAGLAHELALAARNRGRPPRAPATEPGLVLMHGNVAVAYGVSRGTASDGSVRATRYADYYLWEEGAWHAFFAQQTPLTVPEPR